MVGLLHRIQPMSSTKLSTTAQAVLASAAATADHVVTLPQHLPIAAQRAVVKSMLTAGLVEEALAADGQSVWRTTASGEGMLLRATRAGLAAFSSTQTGIPGPEGAHSAASNADQGQVTISAQDTPPSPRMRLRAAAEAILTAWDDTADDRPGLPGAVDALRIALILVKPASAAAPRTPRTGTKQEAVLTLLRRPEGATVVQVADATGWAQHTVRGFFAGLRKKGISVQVLERVRQVGPGKQGAKGSYTIYRIEEVG